MRLPAYALDQAELACASSIRSILGISVTGRGPRRIAERVLTAYIQSMAGKSGSRLAPSTRAIMALEVGQSCEVLASSRANLQGNTKTIRKQTGNLDLKYRFEQLRPGIWRVERRADGSYNKFKSPTRNAKAVFIASIGSAPRLYTEVAKPNLILTDFTKNKARAILGNMDAEWSGKATRGGVLIRRVR